MSTGVWNEAKKMLNELWVEYIVVSESKQVLSRLKTSEIRFAEPNDE